jgi:hypothetical protein
MERNMNDILRSFDAASKTQSPSKVDTSGMLSILKRFDLVESSKTTEGLDKDQKSVNQLSAEFKPKTVKVLGSKTDPKNPMGGKLVGGCEESIDRGVSEDLVSKVRQSLDDYLRSVEDSQGAADRDIMAKTLVDNDLGRRPSNDHELTVKIITPKTGRKLPPPMARHKPNLEIPECKFPVKTFKFEDGSDCEVHGDEYNGFEIHRGNRRLPSIFKTLDEAMMALELFNARRKKDQDHTDQSQDYIDEN